LRTTRFGALAPEKSVRQHFDFRGDTSEIGIQLGQGRFEVLSAIDEKDSGFDIVFLSQFAEEDLGQGCRGRGKQPDVKQVVGLWVCSGVQPELLVVDPNHCFVECDLIR